MNPFMAYDAVTTKITARKSSILNEEKFRKVLESKTVEQIAEFLSSQYNFKSIWENDQKYPLHRDDLETLLNRFVVSELEDILHYFSGPYKEFLQTFLLEFEIYDLILLLRKVSTGKQEANIESHFVHSEKYSSLQYDKLIAAKSVAQLIEKLKGTSYYDVLKTTTGNDFAKREFHVEMKLHLFFYNVLFKQAQKLSLPDRQAAGELLGMKVDSLNVQWIYRAQKYYKISSEQIMIYSLRPGRKLNFTKLKAMCYARSVQDMQALANQYLRSDIFTTDSALDIETNIDRYIYTNVLNKEFRGTIGTIVSYIYLLQIMIKEFIIATETVRYKVPKEEIGDYLVRSMGKEEVKQ